MAVLHWFNPENDLALGAAPNGNYTPPRAAIALRRAGALLPSLWAEPDDEILVIDRVDNAMPRHPAVTTDAAGYDDLRPWGWSRYTAEVMLRHGAMVSALPSHERLDRYRRLSHRDIAAQVLSHIDAPDHLIPVTATSTTEALQAINKFGGRAVVKLPWSCSGRGVVPVTDITETTAKTIENLLHRQGSVTVEPLYDKVRDFAMLFHKSGTSIAYRGLSLFVADNAGHYGGNIIAPQAELMASLPADPTEYIAPLRDALTDLLDDYEGWIGIDMVAYKATDGTLAIAPCIEVNLRMTMGVAALLIHEAGRIEWPRALLRVALPGETITNDSIKLSTVATEVNIPLTAPVVIVSGINNIYQ